MIRFTSTNLRYALSMTGDCQRPLILEKTFGIFIRVPDDNNPGEWLRAYAAGCDPRHDDDWEYHADVLIPEKEYSFLTNISQDIWNAVINEHHDLFMTPSGTTVLTETQPPETVWVRVAEYRNGIERLFDQAHRHFCACVGKREIAAWRQTSLYALDQVIRLDCKRAKPDDREQFARAVSRIKDRINTVTPEGEVLTYSRAR